MAELKTIIFKPKIELYQEAFSKDWRWRITASNGNIIGASSEGYKNKSECLANLRSVGKAALDYNPD